jgi:hypothetical protein
MNRGSAVTDDINGVTMLPQAFRSHPSGGTLVFNEQNAHSVAIRMPARSGKRHGAGQDE